jgi:hypothetical protein
MLDQEVDGVDLFWNDEPRLAFDVPRASATDAGASHVSHSAALRRRQRRHQRRQTGDPKPPIDWHLTL